MHCDIYLTFNDTCAEAMDFYRELLGGSEPFVLTNGDLPMADQVPKERHHLVMHASFRLGNLRVMGSDAPTGMYSKPQGMTVSFTADGPAEAERIFAALSEGGTVRMAMQQTFFADRFGMVIDRFGIPWMVLTEATQA